MSQLEKIVWYGARQGIIDEPLPQALFNQCVKEIEEKHLERYAFRPDEYEEDKQIAVCQYLAYKWSQREVERLGYKELPDVFSPHYQLCIIEMVQNPPDASSMDVLGQKYGLFRRSSYRAPQSMWDVLAERRDGDAVVIMVGDDRGNNEHFIVVQWRPECFGVHFLATGLDVSSSKIV